jgi:hypothetical protein
MDNFEYLDENGNVVTLDSRGEAIDFGNTCITLTFGDQAENHKGMQVIGKPAQNGFNLNDLHQAKSKFERSELIHFNHALCDSGMVAADAYLLIIRNGANSILKDEDATDLFKEQSNLEVDKKALMYGRVVNKHARHNLCFASYDQEPDYPSGRGRIVSFS